MGKQYQKQNGAWVEITPKVASITSGGKIYTGVAPIAVDNTNDEIGVVDATTSAKGVVQIGDNLSVANGVLSSKPWTGHEAASTDIVPADYQDGAIVETDEPVGGSATAVLAGVEQSLSGQAAMVPSSAAVKAAMGQVQRLGSITPTSESLPGNTWTLTDVAVGKPIFIVGNAVSPVNAFYAAGMGVVSGADGALDTRADIFWIGRLSNGGEQYGGGNSCIIIPTDTTVVMYVLKSPGAHALTLVAYQ